MFTNFPQSYGMNNFIKLIIVNLELNGNYSKKIIKKRVKVKLIVSILITFFFTFSFVIYHSKSESEN